MIVPLILSYSVVVNAQTEDSESSMNQVMTVLSDIQKVPLYQVEIDITHLKYHTLMSQLEIIGNQETGDARITLTMPAITQDQPPIQLQLMTYQNAKYYYIKIASLLDQSGLINRDKLTEKQKDFIAKYQDHYIELTPNQVQVKGIHSIAEALWLMPKEEKLQLLLKQNLQQIGNTAIATSQLTDIPEFFYDQTKNLTMNVHINVEQDESQHSLKLQPKVELKADDYGIDLNTKLTLNPKTTGINFEAIRMFTFGKSEYLKELSMDMHSLLEKLKRVDLVVNSQQKRVRWTNIGVIEEMNLNLWSENPAYTRAADYRMNYVYQATDIQLPALTDLPRLSLQEFNYLMNSESIGN